MLRMLEAQAPAKQTATDTINTLSSRLSSATLLEDRRAAILGLRSFAKQFPASVASGALRDLLAALQRDGEDSDTTKVVLETLLMLFEPDENSPEASDEITLWIADEFSMRQDNITALLDLLDTGEFYLRLYSLQILSHVCAERPERAHEAVLAAPLGVSRITAVLDERREAVRDEALMLLVALTPTSAELQKVVAFENAFDKIFTIFESEGGLTFGSTTVQYCLSLLANLLSLNTSNQAYFREIGCVLKVSKLIADVLKEESTPDAVSNWIRPKRDMNVWGLLGVIQLFLVQGSQATSSSQLAFWQSKVLVYILQIAFHQSFGNAVRAKSLETCGAIICGNASLQEQFGDLFVPLIRDNAKTSKTNGHVTGTPGKTSASTSTRNTPAPTETTNVIEALLQLTLESASSAIFELRLAACSCVKSFVEGHAGIRAHVLRRAIEGHKSGDDAIPNILTVILEPSNMRSSSDPYQVWMASVLLLHLLYENPEAKAMALTVSEGNADDGEEVVTLTQSLASNVVAGVQHVEDERALLGYLMLLCIWLFEDPDAVNDLLGEGSNLQGLIAAVKVSSSSMPLVAGLSCLLIGIIYEFSTKDSPISRSTLHSVIMKSLTREVYVDRLTKLRESAFVRDFEVMPSTSDGGLPNTYFDKTFVEFMKDNFSRLARAIDRDPSFEVSVVSNGVQKGVSRELVDSLRAEIEDQKRSIESAQIEILQVRQKFEQEELEHRRTRDSTGVELGRIKHINESLQRNYGEEVEQLKKELERQRTTLSRGHDQSMTQARREFEVTIAQLTKRHEAILEEASSKHQVEKKYLEQRQTGHEREVNRLKESLATQHRRELEQLSLQASKEREQLQSEFERTESESRRIQEQLQSKLDSVTNLVDELRTKAAQTEQTSQTRLQEAEKEKEQTNLQLKTFEGRISEAEARAADFAKREKAAESKAKKTEEQVKAATAKAKRTEDDLKQAQDKLKKVEQDLKIAEEKAAKAEKARKTAAAATTSAKSSPKEIEAKNKEIDLLKKQVNELQPTADKAKDIQTELDDLLVVFADLEAKREADKKRLKDLGEDVSEDEDEDEDGEGDEDDNDDDDAPRDSDVD